MKTAEDCIAAASDLAKQAETFTDLHERAACLKLAEAWLDLAHAAEHQDSGRESIADMLRAISGHIAHQKR